MIFLAIAIITILFQASHHATPTSKIVAVLKVTSTLKNVQKVQGRQPRQLFDGDRPEY